jgi:hypothetical protein
MAAPSNRAMSLMNTENETVTSPMYAPRFKFMAAPFNKLNVYIPFLQMGGNILERTVYNQSTMLLFGNKG